MFWSNDSAHTFHNVSGWSHSKPRSSLVSPFHFDSNVEGSSWSLLELQTESGGMPVGVFHFTAQTIWHSNTSARTWHWFADAHSVGSTSVISAYPYGADRDAGFFMQSEVYRREDFTFLHGCRVPTPRINVITGMPASCGKATTRVARSGPVPRRPGRAIVQT